MYIYICTNVPILRIPTIALDSQWQSYIHLRSAPCYSNIKKVACIYNNFLPIISEYQLFSVFKQVVGRVEKNNWLELRGVARGTSSLPIEVLVINCQIYFINLFILSCLTLNIKLFIFKLFDIKFLFSKNRAFCKQSRTTVYGLFDPRP